MQKALWLATLAFVATAVVTVTLAEYGQSHPDTAVGRLVRTLKGGTDTPAAGAPVALTGSPMINLAEDDRYALRGLKILALAKYEPEAGLSGRAEDFHDEISQPVLPAKRTPRVKDDEEACCCQVLYVHWFSHRCAMAQLKLCDFRHALGKVCDAIAAYDTEEMRLATVKASACVAQECCPPPCGFWQFIDDDAPPCRTEKPCCAATKSCCPVICVPCQPQVVTKFEPLWQHPLPLICGECLEVKPGLCCPCMQQQVFVIERREEAKAVAPKILVKVVTDEGTNEVRKGSGFQIQIEVRIGGDGKVKTEAVTKKCCEGCCPKCEGCPAVKVKKAEAKKCCEGCCQECTECPAVKAKKTEKKCCEEGCQGCKEECADCKAVTIKKEAAPGCKCGKDCKCDNACKCGKDCKCGETPCSEKKEKTEKPAACPGCCGEKKKTSCAEPCKSEMKADPALQQAGFVGAASASKATVRLMTRVVPVGDLLDAGTNEDRLVELCLKMVAPETWQENGGQGQLVYYAPGRCLIARQTPEVMEELEEYVSKMREQAKPPFPPDNQEEGTYWLPFFGLEQFIGQRIQPVRLERAPQPPAMLELVPVSPLDPSVPGFVPAPATPERLPHCKATMDFAAAVIQAQAERQEASHWLFQMLVPFYSFEQVPEKR